MDGPARTVWLALLAATPMALFLYAIGWFFI
jgi:hypothetical protein